MTDLAVGFGLVLVIEGLLWALAPQTALRMLQAVSDMPLGQVKMFGTVSVALGVVVVWLARG